MPRCLSHVSRQFYELILGIDWDNPYSFFNPVYQVKDENGNLQRTITGTIGIFLGMWYVTVFTFWKDIYRISSQ